MNQTQRILIIEDEEDIQALLEYNLTAEGYDVTVVDSGEDAIPLLKKQRPDLVLLDLMLPGLGGLEVCKRIKRDAETQDINIIMVTAKGEEADVVLGLEAGADDYVTKPFSPRILLARVRAILRRTLDDEDAEDMILTSNELMLDPGRFEVRIAGRLVDLSAAEFKLLHHLMQRKGRVYTRQQIIDATMGEDYAVTERSIDVQVVGLRKKLGEFANYVETVRGVGYRFKDN